MISRFKIFQKKDIFTRFFSCLLVLTTLMLISSPIVSQDVLATHLSNELKYQIVFIVGQGCSLFNYEKNEPI